MKSMLFITDSGPALALVRGDQEIHEKKLSKVLGNQRAATRDEVYAVLGVEAGFIGPMGQGIRIVADPVLRVGTYVSGANKVDTHVRGLKAGVHFSPEWADLHVALPGDGCPRCGSPLRGERVIEVGNIFKLGTKYSIPLNGVYLDRDGNEQPIVMGSYGIGPVRIAAAAVEQNHDKDGIIWPKAIAPFDVEILAVNVTDARTRDTAEGLYADLSAAGMDVLLDDRDERPGVKFKDADLIGIPLQVVIGERSLKEGVVEIKRRRTGETEKAPVEISAAAVRRVLESLE